jgi:hypothetical protein
MDSAFYRDGSGHGRTHLQCRPTGQLACCQTDWGLHGIYQFLYGIARYSTDDNHFKMLDNQSVLLRECMPLHPQLSRVKRLAHETWGESLEKSDCAIVSHGLRNVYIFDCIGRWTKAQASVCQLLSLRVSMERWHRKGVAKGAVDQGQCRRFIWLLPKWSDAALL